jgi:hypothetical protein
MSSRYVDSDRRDRPDAAADASLLGLEAQAAGFDAEQEEIDRSISRALAATEDDLTCS